MDSLNIKNYVDDTENEKFILKISKFLTRLCKSEHIQASLNQIKRIFFKTLLNNLKQICG